ncbi:MAG: flagellin [bacterium]|nr:flagellin [bacterium]
MQVHFNQPLHMSYRINSDWTKEQSKVFEKLSSGHCINRSADDCGGLSVSEKIRTQINGCKQALQNTLDGISLLQTSEGIASSIHSMLHRIRTLTVQSCNGTYSHESRNAIQAEIDQIKEAAKAITDVTFNTLPLLKNNENPDKDTQIQLHLGANSGDTFTIDLFNAKKIVDDYINPIDVSTQESSESALPGIDEAIINIAQGRAKIGAQQNRLEKHIKMLQVAHYTQSYSEAMIRDTDMANQMIKLTRNQILIKSGTTMYAQSNLNFKNVLEILPG